MATLRILSSTSRPANRRTEFTDFYNATYPAVAGEILALTGEIDLACSLAASSYAQAWQAWGVVRNFDQPVMWVRADGVRRARRHLRDGHDLPHDSLPLEPAVLDPEDEVLVSALQRLPERQRLLLAMRYMAHLPVAVIAGWFGGTFAEVEAQLDDGFDALVDTLEWSVDEPGYEIDDEYYWTAQVLDDCAQRLREGIPAPPLTSSFGHPSTGRVTRGHAPLTATALAACVGLVVFLSPSPPAAEAVGYLAPPPAPAALPSPIIDVQPDAPPTDVTAPVVITEVMKPAPRAMKTHTAMATATVAPVPATATAPPATASATAAAITPATTTSTAPAALVDTGSVTTTVPTTSSDTGETDTGNNDNGNEGVDEETPPTTVTITKTVTPTSSTSPTATDPDTSTSQTETETAKESTITDVTTESAETKIETDGATVLPETSQDD